MNEQTSEQRWLEFYNENRLGAIPTAVLVGMRDVWNYQEIYWSKRVEEMEKALDFIIRGQLLVSTDSKTWYAAFINTNTVYRGSTPIEVIQNAMKCDSQGDDKDDILPSKVRVAPSDKSDEERK